MLDVAELSGYAGGTSWRYSLVMPGVRDAPVHAQLVTLHLVELVAGIRVLP
jgi:hypothetical protein